MKSDGTKGWIRRFSPLKGKKRLRLLPTSARKITCDVAVQGACGAGEQFCDPEQTVTRNRDGLPFDTLVAMHEGVRVVPDIVDRELVGFGDEAFGRERIRSIVATSFMVAFRQGVWCYGTAKKRRSVAGTHDVESAACRPTRVKSARDRRVYPARRTASLCLVTSNQTWPSRRIRS